MTSGVYERTPEICAILSEAHRNSDAVKAHNDAMRGVPISPEHRAAISKVMTPEHRAVLSETCKNSEAMQSEHEKQRGGDDILYHHWLYDDADLSKYTMPMTRKDHAVMHNRMRADGYTVPHINSDIDDNGLWGYA
jgi:hypothetical protein